MELRLPFSSKISDLNFSFVLFFIIAAYTLQEQEVHAAEVL